MATTAYHVLEINLISAQGLLQQPVKRYCHMKTYAVLWVDSSTKLRTRVDRVGGKNPTWNDKFLFRVSPEFLSNKTSAVSVEIYAVGIFRDRLIGSVRLVISSFFPTTLTAAMETPAFAARLIQSPSGNLFGILNVGGMVRDSFTGFQILSEVSAIDYHELRGENLNSKHHPRTNKSKTPVTNIIEYFIPSDSSHHESEAGDSLTSSSSSSPLPPTVLRELSLKEKNEDHGVLSPDKEALEISCVNMEQTLAANLVPLENVISDKEGSMVQMEKDMKMIMEENKKLREMVEMLKLETEGQSSVISEFSGRVKNLEKKLSRRNKQKKRQYRRTASAVMHHKESHLYQA